MHFKFAFFSFPEERRNLEIQYLFMGQVEGYVTLSYRGHGQLQSFVEDNMLSLGTCAMQ